MSTSDNRVCVNASNHIKLVAALSISTLHNAVGSSNTMSSVVIVCLCKFGNVSSIFPEANCALLNTNVVRIL